MEDYKTLLKKARAQLPKEVFKKERFDVPVLKSIVIGKKTEVINFVAAANTIRRKPDHILKYLTKALASPGIIEGNKVTFSGTFGNTIINEKFNKYLIDFVLCKECKKPDTKILKDSGHDFLKCEACGARRPIQKLK